MDKVAVYQLKRGRALHLSSGKYNGRTVCGLYISACTRDYVNADDAYYLIVKCRKCHKSATPVPVADAPKVAEAPAKIEDEFFTRRVYHTNYEVTFSDHAKTYTVIINAGDIPQSIRKSSHSVWMEWIKETAKTRLTDVSREWSDLAKFDYRMMR